MFASIHKCICVPDVPRQAISSPVAKLAKGQERFVLFKRAAFLSHAFPSPEAFENYKGRSRKGDA